MNNALIIPACTDLNRGDQALVWEAHKFIKDVFGSNINVKILNYGNNTVDRDEQSRQTRLSGKEILENLVEHPGRIIKKKTIQQTFSYNIIVSVVAILDLIKLNILLLFPYQKVVALLWSKKQAFKTSFRYTKNTDIFFVKGGGFLHTYGKFSDLYYLFFNTYYMLLAFRLKKKVVVLPNSFGPITGKVSKYYIKKILSKCFLVYSREPVSAEYLREIGVKNIKIAPDFGYFNDANETNDETIKLAKNSIGITLRPYRFPQSRNPNEAYENYILSMAKISDWLFNEGYDINFIVQVKGPSAHETDLIAIHDVIKKLSSKTKYMIIDGDYNYQQLTMIYAQCRFLIGTRFHSIIFAQNNFVPALAIGYGGNKSSGIMSSLGLDDFVIKIEEITYDKLLKKFIKLQSETETYVWKLKKYRETLIDEREFLINELKSIYKES